MKNQMIKVITLINIRTLNIPLYFPEKDACDPNPCKNNAQCVPTAGGSYNCICPAGFNGLDCSRKSPKSIPNGVSAIDMNDVFMT